MREEKAIGRQVHKKKMDPYFRPILISSLGIILLNTLVTIPVAGAPLLVYFFGGVLAVFLFKNKHKEREIKMSDIAILGIGTGILAGAVLALIIAIKLQDQNLQQHIISLINESIATKSTKEPFNGSAEELKRIDELGPAFMIITGVFTVLIGAAFSFFGSLCTMPFIYRKKK